MLPLPFEKVFIMIGLFRNIIRGEVGELFRLGVPIVVGQLGIIIMSLADTMMVGWYGTKELGAAAFVNNLFNLVIIFAVGFSYGITPIVGALFGRRERCAIGGVLRNALCLNCMMSLVLMSVMGILYLNLHRLGQPVELIALMRPYFLVLLFSLPFTMIFNAFKQFAEGITDTKTPMYILLCGNMLNIVLNWMLIYGHGLPELGLLGAGVATFISRVMMVVIFALIFALRKGYLPFREGFLQSKINRQSLSELNRMGLPIALQMGMETSSFSLATIIVGWIGTSALAAHQIMNTVGQLGFMLYYGMAAAVAVRVSNFYGRGEVDNLRHSARSGFYIILVMAAFVSAGMLIFRESIGGLFTDNEEVIALVSAIVIPFVVYQVGDGLQCNYANALRGISDVKPLTLFAFIAYFVISLPAGYLFGIVLDMGLVGVWLSFPLGLTTAGVLYYLRFRYRTRRLL